MRSMFKYEVQFDTVFMVEMPEGAIVRHIEIGIDGVPSMWCEVDTEARMQNHHFGIFGTGHPIPAGWEWRGTFIQGNFVWHLFETD